MELEHTVDSADGKAGSLQGSEGVHEEGITVIEARPGWVPLDLKEIWEYRELLWYWGVRQVKVRYKQTILGASWAILQPLAQMVVFTVFFGNLAGISSEGIPYPLFSYVALVPWNMFSTSLSNTANSLVGNRQILSKVYVPRAILPMASMFPALVDFALAFLIVFGMMAFYGFSPAFTSFAAIGFLLLAMGTALGAGLFFSAMNVQFRDIKYTVPFLSQLWMFSTPVVYSQNLIPESWEFVYALNPMATVINGFRWSMLGVGSPPGMTALASLGVTLTLLVVGGLYFRRMEGIFVDVV